MRSDGGFFLGSADTHLLGKILDHVDDEVLRDLGFTHEERERAEWVFDDMNAFLTDRVGFEWNDVEVG